MIPKSLCSGFFSLCYRLVSPMADVDKVTVVSSLDIHKRSVVGHVLNVFFDKNENKFVAESHTVKQVPRLLLVWGI